MKSFDIYHERTKEIDDNYVVVTYRLPSTENVAKAAWDLAIGQSVGNPNVRNAWETDELLEKHSCIILADKKSLLLFEECDVQIGFPIINLDWEEDGISHLLCMIMGGQMDIQHITKCRIVDIQFPDKVKRVFGKPRYGLSGMRAFTKRYDVPLLGGIIKPKTGLSPEQLLDMTKQLVDGGVDFIKEDEILSNPIFCRLDKRVELIANYLAKSGNRVVYAHCINADPHDLLARALRVCDGGGNGVHVNIWSGFGAYHAIRQMGLPLYLHYQKSGDRVITNPSNAFSISWRVLCKLAALSGVDTIHTGMYGGYLSDDEAELRELMTMLQEYNVVPALSCGMHPGLVNMVTDKFGCDYLANVGGAIHGHPDGTKAGALAMRQAIVGRINGSEYISAIAKWGLNK